MIVLGTLVPKVS